jgi:TatD DNase family protein
MLIDSHCHIQGKEYVGEIDAVLARARAAGVETVIAVGGAGEMSSNRDAVALADTHANVYATVGMHPHDAKDVAPEDLEELRYFSSHPKVVAVGETGLDYYYDHSPRELQRRGFSQFIRMAIETSLPIVVHERDAFTDAAELLRKDGEGKLRGVIHCFTGTQEAADAYLALNFYLSFTGIITFKNAGALRAVVRAVPLEKILVETDSPYLTPVPFRGKRNEPALVRYVAETIADVKGLTPDEVARVTTENVRELFRI